MPNFPANARVVSSHQCKTPVQSDLSSSVACTLGGLHDSLLGQAGMFLLFLIVWCGFANTAIAADTQGGTALQAKYKELTPQLKNNQFQRPIYLNSSESPNELNGNIYAVIDQPFANASRALNIPANWCDMLILHLNTKYCRASGNAGNSALQVSIGKKHDQPLDEAYPVNFKFAVVASTPDYLHVALNAKDGPMGTRDYRILLEAVPLANGKTFLHLTYSYAYGVTARVAMAAYLSTVGSNKVGFTRVDGAGADEQYINGVRGVVERNTMRYYLAIDAYLSSLKLPASEQFENRLQTWFAGTERYARQLKEVGREDYMAMKRSEYQRQQTAQ